MHHANVIIGRKEWALACIPEEDRMLHADIHHLYFDRMGIDHARTLIHEARLRPVERTYRTFILTCDVLPHETQNALLKLFEEPNEHTLFYLIVPYGEMLLPTLRSRLNVLQTEIQTEAGDAFAQFQKLSFADRLAMIAERVKAEDTAWITQIVSGFERHMRTKRDVQGLQDALLTSTYLNTPGNSKKMLLEHISLLM